MWKICERGQVVRFHGTTTVRCWKFTEGRGGFKGRPCVDGAARSTEEFALTIEEFDGRSPLFGGVTFQLVAGNVRAAAGRWTEGSYSGRKDVGLGQVGPRFHFGRVDRWWLVDGLGRVGPCPSRRPGVWMSGDVGWPLEEWNHGPTRPRPDVLTGPAETRGKWEMSSWSRGVRSATPGWSGSRGR